MLEDRDYMRESGGGRNWSATVSLLVILAVVYLLQITVLSSLFPGGDYMGYLALSLEGVRHGFVWQLLSYQFLHASFLHLFFNGWALFVFGREIEYVLGKGRFLALYFSAGVIGGLFQLFAAWVWPGYFDVSAVGASAGIFGVVAAYAMTFPERELTLLLFFIIPVRLRAKTLLLIELIITAIGISAVGFPIIQSLAGSNVAHAAHLGGILTGLAFIRFRGNFNFRNPFAGWRKPRVKNSWPPAESADEFESEEFISREVDPILDKISQQGIQSLTERERRILEAARSKMAKK